MFRLSASENACATTSENRRVLGYASETAAKRRSNAMRCEAKRSEARRKLSSLRFANLAHIKWLKKSSGVSNQQQ